jgi:hypothetical protein
MTRKFAASLLRAGAATVPAVLLSTGFPATVGAASNRAATDPGVRAGIGNSGRPLFSLSADEQESFADGQTRFVASDTVTGTNRG